MGAIGIITATIGYTLVYYGVQLFSGAPVTMAYALGLTDTNNAPHGADTVPAPFTATPGGGMTTTGSRRAKRIVNKRTGPVHRLKHQGPGQKPVVAPPP